MYNLKLTTYANGLQRIMVFDHIIKQGTKRPPRKKEKTPFGTWASECDYAFPRHSLYEVMKEYSHKESMKRAKAKVFDYAMSNSWDYFVTLTFNKEKVDRYDYDSCVKAMKSFLKYARRRNPDFKYILVPELHEDGAFHFHGLFADCPNLPMTDSGHKDKKRRTVYNIDGYKYGFTTVTKVTDSKAAGNYMTKYITKALCAVSKGRKRYWKSRNLNEPRVETICIQFPDKEVALDTLWASSRYHKECGRDEYKCWFFEYDPGVNMSIAMFEPFRFMAGVS